ncbi:MAG: sugar phosphate isomerase/epimerase family protein [Bacteroidota bacterium]
MKRRHFITRSAQFSLGMGFLGLNACQNAPEAIAEKAVEAAAQAASEELWFKISLAQWSLHKAFFSGSLDNLDFAAKARNTFGLGGVEYVNQFFKDKAEDMAYLGDMKQRAADHGVASLLIMVDLEGQLGNTQKNERIKAVENHYKWVNAAKFLGCHSIRVNAATDGDFEEGMKAATEGLHALSEYAAKEDINIIVENHGGFSSNGLWLSKVIAGTGMRNCGTLPDFGNFCVEKGEDGCADEYDRYQGVTELMPYAKAVSAKTHDFDEAGNEVHSDYQKMLSIVKQAGYKGWIGVEYEGRQLSEEDGIQATIDLLKKYGPQV